MTLIGITNVFLSEYGGPTWLMILRMKIKLHQMKK